MFKRASMGPQHIAAENVTELPASSSGQSRFNGAAAHRCGKLEAKGCGQFDDEAASMGPQHIAAENGT